MSCTSKREFAVYVSCQVIKPYLKIERRNSVFYTRTKFNIFSDITAEKADNSVG